MINYMWKRTGYKREITYKDSTINLLNGRMILKSILNSYLRYNQKMDPQIFLSPVFHCSVCQMKLERLQSRNTFVPLCKGEFPV